jgi:hypothetical protein
VEPKTLELQVKSAYGVERIYPINETAKKMAELMKAKSFTKTDLDKFKSLGFAIKWVPITIME